jgi:hypothetical protein
MTCRNYDIICSCRSYPPTQVVPADQLPLAALIVAAFAAVDKSNKTNPNRNNKLLLVVEVILQS